MITTIAIVLRGHTDGHKYGRQRTNTSDTRRDPPADLRGQPGFVVAMNHHIGGARRPR